MKETYYVKLDDVAETIMNYIDTEDFTKAAKASTDVNSFMSGLGMAACVVMARCPRYIVSSPEKE